MHQVNKIFVYGTLLNGLLKAVLPETDLHITKIEKGKIKARLFDLGKYPGARPTAIATRDVIGEVYEIDHTYFDQVLLALDDYEGYYPAKKKRSLYLRKKVNVLLEDGSLQKAWVYWYNRPVSGKIEIEKGDYKNYLK